MKLTEDQYEVLSAYLNNELSEADRLSFETDLQADPELAAEVDLQRNLRLGFRALGIQQALDQAKASYQASVVKPEPVSETKPVVRPLISWQYWAAAASVVVVLGIGLYQYRQGAGRQVDGIYTESVGATTDDELLKSFPASSTKTGFLDALKNYKARNYDEAIEKLKVLPADRQTIHYKNYLLGLSYLANDQSTEAIPLLAKARETPSPVLQQKAEWFLALAYVKNRQKEQALPILTRISTDQAHPFHSLAQRVLNKIQ
ncbi:hypothetical protein ACO2Q8_21695 [Larkinella sp. VNQ87]|uniref:hypothetical protein n=1 Tax=Larkinella sp. VNQ87 TaxID=3400921 RepID=UPI003C0F057E